MLYLTNMESNKRLDLIFFGLSDQMRRSILSSLSEGPKSVGELAKDFDMTLAGVSKNISLLEKAGLIYKTKNGRTVTCHMNFDIWQEVIKFVGMYASFWSHRLDELEYFIKGKSLPTTKRTEE